jgi:pimeloyl-ACP methyl ester carboxylesterase
VTRWLLAVPFGLLAAYAVWAAFRYTRMISNIFMGLVYKSSWTPSLAARGEKVSILDSSDREIPALVAGEGRDGKLALFCHESGHGKESWERYAAFLADAGWRVLAIDLDEKDNPLSQWPDAADVERFLTAARWAKKAFQPAAPVLLFGVSKGANVVLAASLSMPMPCLVVSDGLFSMKQMFRDRIRRWAPILVRPNLFGENYPDWVVNGFTGLGLWHCQRRSRRRFVDTERCLRQAHPPLLMIHGDADDLVPTSHQEFLRALPSARVSHWTAAGARHNEAAIVDRDRYEKKIMDFLRTGSEA